MITLLVTVAYAVSLFFGITSVSSNAIENTTPASHAENVSKGVVERSGHINVARISGSINPASSDYLRKSIAQSEEEDAALLLIELDTPGGLVASTKDIIQAMLGSRIPIVVYVSPHGAWAGSAGTFIALAAHVAAMAPGSSIGAAHPVGIGGGGRPSKDADGQPTTDHSAQKAENLLAAFIESIATERKRNVEWAEKAVRESVAVTAGEALDLNVIDIVADDRDDLLEQLEGRVVAVRSAQFDLRLGNSVQRDLAMGSLTRFLNILVDPNVAMILLVAGIAGLYIEFNQPGLIIPGVAGAFCLLLTLIAMQILPFSWVGVLLMAIGIALFAAELFFTSYGLLFGAGVVALLIGGSMLFDRPEVSDLNVEFWSVLVPTVAGMAIFGGIVLYAVGRSMGRRQVAGVSELIGMIGVTTTRLDLEGTVSLRGEFWHARSKEAIEVGERVETVAVDGLELLVKRAPIKD